MKNCLAKLVFLLRCSPTFKEPDLLFELALFTHRRPGMGSGLLTGFPRRIRSSSCSKSHPSSLSGFDGDHFYLSFGNVGELTLTRGFSQIGSPISLAYSQWLSGSTPLQSTKSLGVPNTGIEPPPLYSKDRPAHLLEKGFWHPYERSLVFG